MQIYDLPKITNQQTKFVMALAVTNNQTQAYKQSYNCENMSEDSIRAEASKLVKNPKVKAWLDYAMKKSAETVEAKFTYSIENAFEELNDLQQRCRNFSKTYNVEKGCIETKCKLAGLLNDNSTNTNVNVGLDIPTIKVNGKEIDFNIGG